jgi:hypothetical protein
MHNSLKIIKPLLYSYSALHVSGTFEPIIRSLLILHIQPPVTVCIWVGCIFKLWSVTTVAKATNQMHNSLKIIKTLLYSYYALHVSGTFAPIIRSLLILHIQPPVTVFLWVGCIFQLWSVTTIAKATNQMHNSLKIIKILLYSYSALHVSGTLAPIIRILLILHIQPPVTVCRWVGCIFQLWFVTTVAKATVVTVEKNGECAACLKYTVLIVAEKKIYIKCNIWRVVVRPSYI